MSGERRSQSKDLWRIIQTHGVGCHPDLEEELANILRQEIDNEIIADLNREYFPRLLHKLAPVHPTDVFPRCDS